MYIKILKSTVCAGQRVKADAVLDAPTKDAKFLINSGKAVECDEPKAAKKSEPKQRAAKKAPVNRMVEAEDLDNRDAGE
ncbi:MAG: hypothetical protein V2I38_08905 [Alcanivoracaceae bacterium]|jgi:hypothetical protein|nr:hypothetical protein [Alcanivoracaceae bacterium]